MICIYRTVLVLLLNGMSRWVLTDHLRLGLRKQLFVDNDVVNKATAVSRQLGSVEKANRDRSVLVPEQPWVTGDITLRLRFHIRQAKLYAFQPRP